jgi:glycerophosphoryl diester phosphodiesterase
MHFATTPFCRRDFLKATSTAATALGVGFAALPFSSFCAEPASSSKSKKFVIGHRGACAYAPENTIPSYQLAIKQGADYVEQDLQITKDGVLVCCHDSFLERISNVADVFPDRFVEEEFKGKKVKRWFFYNFTLKEIKQLDAGSRFDPKFKDTTVPTWQEAIDEIRGKAGLCPETKTPDMYSKLGFDMEELVLQTLKKNGLEKPNAATPILLQTFGAPAVKRLADKGIQQPILQLANAGVKWTDVSLKQAKELAVGISPSKNDVTAELVNQAHALGLQVVPYTYNKKALPPEFSSVRAEMEHALYDLGVDGMFTDNPDQFPRRKV